METIQEIKIEDFIFAEDPEEAMIEVVKETQSLLNNYRKALNNHAIISVTDLQGKILNVNDQFCKISKYSRDELVGQTHGIVNSSYHSKEFFEHLWKTISSGHVWQGLIRNKAKDDSYYWVKSSIFPFIDKNKMLKAYVSVRTDVTELIDSKRELELTKDLLAKEKVALNSKSLALNELFQYLENEKKKVLKTITTNLEVSVLPLLESLIERHPEARKELQVVQKNLKDVANPIIRKVQNFNKSLTPKELRICNLISQGLSAKEIANMMHLSIRTIDKHRENIRKKLHITDRKINLGSYLLNK